MDSTSAEDFNSEPLDTLRDESKDILKDELAAADERITIHRPLKDLKLVAPGSVLVSKSGNVRLVFHVEHQVDRTFVRFLTRFSNGEVRLESAILEAIDPNRLDGLALFRNRNPLGKFKDIIATLPRQTATIHNTEVLLGWGYLGSEFKSHLASQRVSEESINVDLYLSKRSGMIRGIGTASTGSCVKVGLVVNHTRRASREYVSQALFYYGIPEHVRSGLLLASVLTNCIENVRNYYQLRAEIDKYR